MSVYDELTKGHDSKARGDKDSRSPGEAGHRAGILEVLEGGREVGQRRPEVISAIALEAPKANHGREPE